MSDASSGKTNRRGFLKWAIAAGVGAAAVAGGAAAFLGRQEAPVPSPTPTPSPTTGGGKYGAVGSPINLKIGYLPYAANLVTADVIKQGRLLEKYLPAGSTITWYRFLGGVLVTNNLLAEKIDIGYMGDAPIYRALDVLPGQPKVICHNGYDEALAGDAAMKKFGEPKSLVQSIVVRPDVADKYKTIEDLNGKTIGVPIGSISHKQILALELPPYNIKMTSIDLGTELQMAQLRAGTLELAATWEPYVLWMEAKKVAKRFISSSDHLCECRTGTHFHIHGDTIAREDLVKERPDIIEAYLNAEEDAREMLTKDPQGTAELIWTDVTDVPMEILLKDAKMMVWDGRIHPEQIIHHEKLAQSWKEHGIMRGEKGVPPKELVDKGFDPSLLNKVIEKRKKEGKWTSEDTGILRNW